MAAWIYKHQYVSVAFGSIWVDLERQLFAAGGFPGMIEQGLFHHLRVDLIR